MSKVIFDTSISLDGFMTAANPRPRADGRRRPTTARVGDGRRDEHNRRFLEEAIATLGAVIAGRTAYDTLVPWWGADGPTGPARRPVFIVTHEPPAEHPEGRGVHLRDRRDRACPGAGEGRRWRHAPPPKEVRGG
jgi:hypothetical protein